MINSRPILPENMTTRYSLIEINAMARKVDADSRIPLHYYYRIADSLLKQASIYRGERNIVDLYVMLLRYSSLVCETIPLHRDYQDSLSKQRVFYRKKLVGVLDELETLKPEVQRRADELNQFHGRDQQPVSGSRKTSTELAAIHWRPTSTQQQTSTNPQSSWTANTLQVGNQFQNLSINLPLPKKETLSRHSFLGATGLRGQWQGPSSAPKVQYPSYSELAATENSGLSQVERHSLLSVKDSDRGRDRNMMESVLSLDDGRWISSAEESSLYFNKGTSEDRFLLGNVRQPSPPPILAKINQEYSQISPSRVADPRPGPAKPSQDDVGSSNGYQDLHIPVKIMDDFLRLARESTAKNLETCGILAGSLKNRVFYITTLIIPKQESTSDSCQTLNEEEIFEVQDKRSLFPLGWIHTHPSQTCFMSSVDLHTHYSYQIMLPEAIAIVMAPTDTSSPHGIFHLSDPSGVSVIRNCQERGFHPHEEPLDGNSIYEHCSHVYMNPNMKFEVLDLR